MKQLTDLNNWKEHIADMPQKDEAGKWYDAETGIYYTNNSEHEQKRKVDKKSLEARNKAKLLGGKALKGTFKQKQWAEKIRAEILSKVNSDAAKSLVENKIFSCASFWIDNRSQAVDYFNTIEKEYFALTKIANELLNKAESSIVEEFSEIYKRRIITPESSNIYDEIMTERAAALENIDKLLNKKSNNY